MVAFIAGIGRSIYLKTTEVTKFYNIEDSYSDIKIEGKNIDVNIDLSNDNENKIIYTGNKKVYVESKVIDGVLVVYQKDDRKFYDTLFNFNDFEINLYLSQTLINSLNIKGGTGDVEINKGFTFNNVDINNSTGDIEFKSNITNNLSIKNSTGDIDIENIDIGGNVSIQTDTGDIELRSVNCNNLDIKIDTGDTELINVLVVTDFNLIGDTGEVIFEGFDASNIYVTVDTGDVKGTILSSKIFVARSKTGRINVPETLTGGVCKILTDTGDIKISYK